MPQTLASYVPTVPKAPAGKIEPILDISDLRTWFFTRDGVVRAVDGVSFHVIPGETLAIVGESGCGKSVTALSILRLIPSPPGRIVSGAIRFAGRDLLGLSESEMRDVRGNDISMIFQEPMTSLNPVLTIGRQIAETLMDHQRLADLTADRQHRVEARHRLLEDHRDVVAADRAHLAIGQLQQILAREADGASDPARRLGNQPHHRHRGDRLAAAGFADDGERLALVDMEGHTVHRAVDAAGGTEVGLEIFDL